MQKILKKVFLIMVGCLLLCLPLLAAEKSELYKQGQGLAGSLKQAKKLKEKAAALGLEVDNDLVVLSACQTGLGKITSGDDVIGLNRAFFYAGTHTIVSSLWRVSDISTAILIKQFYRRYASYDKADSLRLATLHVKNRYPHPGYWAAFTLVGDYF